MPIPVRRTADARRENVGKLTRGYNKAGEMAKGAAKLAGEALFGEEGRIPLAASLIPGADLVDKLSAGKRPGLLDLPGLSDAKMLKALLIAGVPVEQIFKAFGRKIGQSDDVADAFAERIFYRTLLPVQS